MFYSTKTYGNDRGLSCAFRQWRATHSHCSLIHGYSLGIKLVFSSETLDDRNWVMDFGGLKMFKEWTEHMFDHTLCVAFDDPELEFFERMNEIGGGYNNQGLIDLRIVPGVGCEMFAKMCYDEMSNILDKLRDNAHGRYPVPAGVRLVSAEVFEHDANSAIYEGQK